MNKEKIIIGICDDEDYFRHQVKMYCESYLDSRYENYEIVIMHSGEEVLQYQGEQIAILFLDIELKGMDGISVMQELLNKNYIWRIVFISTHEELVWDTFSIKTLGFERKPLQEERIGKYIQTALNELQKDVVIRFKKNDEDAYVKLSELYYVEGNANYIEVHTKSKKHLIAGTIGEWEEKLQGTSVVRIHKSYLVNLEYAQIKGQKAQIDEVAVELPIGRKFKNLVREKYDNYIMERMRERA